VPALPSGLILLAAGVLVGAGCNVVEEKCPEASVHVWIYDAASQFLPVDDLDAWVDRAGAWDPTFVSCSEVPEGQPVPSGGCVHWTIKPGQVRANSTLTLRVVALRKGKSQARELTVNVPEGQYTTMGDCVTVIDAQALVMGEI
jgi:hypothetical protein